MSKKGTVVQATGVPPHQVRGHTTGMDTGVLQLLLEHRTLTVYLVLYTLSNKNSPHHLHHKLLPPSSHPDVSSGALTELLPLLQELVHSRHLSTDSKGVVASL